MICQFIFLDQVDIEADWPWMTSPPQNDVAAMRAKFSLEYARITSRAVVLLRQSGQHQFGFDAVTSARFKERIVAGAELERDGVVAFRGVDAQRILKEEFDIDCSLSSTYRLLHRMKLSWLARRPRHPQADATAQVEFSQLLDCN